MPTHNSNAVHRTRDSSETVERSQHNSSSHSFVMPPRKPLMWNSLFYAQSTHNLLLSFTGALPFLCRMCDSSSFRSFVDNSAHSLKYFAAMHGLDKLSLEYISRFLASFLLSLSLPFTHKSPKQIENMRKSCARTRHFARACNATIRCNAFVYCPPAPLEMYGEQKKKWWIHLLRSIVVVWWMRLNTRESLVYFMHK